MDTRFLRAYPRPFPPRRRTHPLLPFLLSRARRGVSPVTRDAYIRRLRFYFALVPALFTRTHPTCNVIYRGEHRIERKARSLQRRDAILTSDWRSQPRVRSRSNAIRKSRAREKEEPTNADRIVSRGSSKALVRGFLARYTRLIFLDGKNAEPAGRRRRDGAGGEARRSLVPRKKIFARCGQDERAGRERAAGWRGAARDDGSEMRKTEA